jgi:hypothetical protein
VLFKINHYLRGFSMVRFYYFFFVVLTISGSAVAVGRESQECYSYKIKPKADSGHAIGNVEFYLQEGPERYVGMDDDFKANFKERPSQTYSLAPASNELVRGCPLSMATLHTGNDFGGVFSLVRWSGSGMNRSKPNLVCTYVNPLSDQVFSCKIN